MTTCSSNPTAGCDNSEIVAAINGCCDDTNTNLEAITAKLTTINQTQVDCCAMIETKFDSVISLLTVIANK